MNNRIAMFPGSFDPPTNGHLDIVKRVSRLYDKVYVVIANNIEKHTLFSTEERYDLFKNITSDIDNVEIVIWEGLVTDFAKKNNVGVIVRGVRASDDFGYEFELAQTNKLLCPELEILFIPTNPKYFLLRSSAVKEMAKYGADVSSMVPEYVLCALKAKLCN